MILTVKDETIQALMKRHGLTSVTGAVNYVNRILDKASREDIAGGLVLSSDIVTQLRDMLGGFTTAEDLANRIRRIGQIRVQDRPYVLTSEQLARLKQEAFGHARNGEPRSESQATPEQANEIVQRYMTEQIDYFIKMMCGQL